MIVENKRKQAVTYISAAKIYDMHTKHRVPRAPKARAKNFGARPPLRAEKIVLRGDELSPLDFSQGGGESPLEKNPKENLVQVF